MSTALVLSLALAALAHAPSNCAAESKLPIYLDDLDTVVVGRVTEVRGPAVERPALVFDGSGSFDIKVERVLKGRVRARSVSLPWHLSFSDDGSIRDVGRRPQLGERWVGHWLETSAGSDYRYAEPADCYPPEATK